ncbi:PorV/PorQ family protein [candidate division KSB1 bacterium]|nr:PorV/PorQ family protein [candidate division KSB1 bacterium]TDJ00142.1 MAG: PorV/PorQ family protein [Caldithrix sp.]
MQRVKTVFFFMIVILFSTNFSVAQTGNAGATGLAFLKLGVGARAGGMGGAFSAISDDATATFWNPAGLTYSRAQVAFTHTEWLQDITNEFLAITFPAFRGTLGLSFYTNSVGGIERRLNPSEEPIGTVEANDVALGLSYATSISSSLKAGLTVKYLYEKIFIESAAGYAFDFGLILQPFSNPLQLAVVAQNFGSMDKLRAESINLPKTVRLGISYLFALDGIGGKVLLAADGVKVIETDFRGSFGAELQFKSQLAVRVGYQTGLSRQAFGGGLGLKMNRYHLDYGFIPFDSNFGDTHRFSFALDL